MVKVFVVYFWYFLQAGHELIASFDWGVGVIADYGDAELDAVDIGDIEQVKSAGHGDSLYPFLILLHGGQLGGVNTFPVGVFIQSLEKVDSFGLSTFPYLATESLGLLVRHVKRHVESGKKLSRKALIPVYTCPVA